MYSSYVYCLQLYLWFVIQAILACTVEDHVLLPDSEFTPQTDVSSVELVDMKARPRSPFENSTLGSLKIDDEWLEVNACAPRMPESDLTDSDTDAQETQMSSAKGSHPFPPSDDSSDSASDSSVPVSRTRVLMFPPAEDSTSDEESDSTSDSSEPASRTRVLISPPAEDSTSDEEPFNTTHELMSPPAEASTSEEESDSVRICLVEARKSWTASDQKKQLSFDEGDIIQVFKTPSKWHLGSIYLSDNHPIAGQARYFPSNFVQHVSMEDMKTLIQARAERDRHLPQAVESDSDSSD